MEFFEAMLRMLARQIVILLCRGKTVKEQGGWEAVLALILFILAIAGTLGAGMWILLR